MQRIWVLGLLVFTLCTSLHAKWLRLPYMGLRPGGMGNAFIAIADDKNAVFYNPAGLAQLSGEHFDLYDVMGGADSMDTVNRLAGILFQGNSADSLRSDTQYTRISFTPTYYTKNFSMGFIANLQTYVDLRDLTADEVDIFSANDIGFIASGAIPLSKTASIGMTAKILQRMGVDLTTTPAELLTLTGVDQDTLLNNVYDSLKNLQRRGWGYGFDIGLLVRNNQLKRGSFASFALTATDLLMNFRAIGGSAAPVAVAPAVHMGFGWTQRHSENSEWNIAFDIRNIGATTSIPQMIALGFEYRLFGVSAMFGAHQGQLTYGLMYNAKNLKVGFVSVGSELGTNFFQRPTRYYLAQLALGLHGVE